ncbi:hypothetical protein CGLO_18264 [Colletotrichum gloeosporioides Cg-14]|uniref:Uncharacterized protein n=1 Tax=Colletotrichum gloeosporioides (strain Cg-14) TaxID=1237896 RepID=T0L4H5_COLGC|nr:hypothetical protein CGLO_18264 [Colletotrichum gloeosporioides Cg-14]
MNLDWLMPFKLALQSDLFYIY